jgi:hypothetical protein
VAVLRVRGYALPEGDPVDLYADGDRWTTEPVANADLVAEGWLLPGLVDAHTHPGAQAPGDPLDEAVLRDDLREHLAAGVTLIRAPGLAGEPPAWFGQGDESPRAVHAGASMPPAARSRSKPGSTPSNTACAWIPACCCGWPSRARR